MAFWFRVVLGQKSPENAVSQEDMIKFMTTFTQKLMLWGSDSVLKEYTRFRQSSMSASGEQDASNTLLVLEDLLFAIRADMGHRNSGLRRGDLLALFVNDIDEHLAKTPLRRARNGARHRA